jgi:predicted nucleic acid-binding protein
MPKIVIADTSCLILFSKIKLLHILNDLYSTVFITPEVADEFEEPIPQWITTQSAQQSWIDFFNAYNLGAGELTSLALAMQLKNVTVILDDEKAKKIAKSFHLEVTGSLGIIVKAKRNSVIKNVKEVLNKIKQTNFHLPASLEETILKASGESD